MPRASTAKVAHKKRTGDHSDALLKQLTGNTAVILTDASILVSTDLLILGVIILRHAGARPRSVIKVCASQPRMQLPASHGHLSYPDSA